jgi:hypothetical protein
VAILWLARGMTFFADEWAVIVERPISLDNFLQPFNEHWLGVTTLVYRLLLERLGLGSYLPYLALLLALHVIVVLEVYLLARRSAGAVLGALAAVIVAVLGSGFENLYWAMQIGFSGAIALGLGALIVLDRDATRGRVVLATALLTVGMMTSGFGIFMLAFVGLEVLLTPGRRRVVAALFVPAGIYLAWYLAFGRSGLATHRDPFTIAALLDVPAFVADGAGTAIGSAFGVGPIVGRVGAVVLAVAIGWRVVRRGLGSVPARTLAGFGAIVVQYAILGLIRAQLFEGAAEYSRYAYLSTIFALLGLVALIAPLEFMRLPRWRVARLGALTAVATLALTWNVWLLIAGREIFLERADRTRATIVVAQGDLGPGVDPDVAMLLDRRVSDLRSALERFGSPLTDSLAGDAVRPIPPALIEEIRSELLESSATH